MEDPAWPDPRDVARLPANQRRVVATVLATVREQLEDLERRGALRLPEGALDRLERLERAAREEPPQRHAVSLLAVLQVQADDLEPERLAAYGPLSPPQEATLRRLAGALRTLLDGLQVAADDPGGAASAVTLRPIGVVHSPFTAHSGTPIQPRFAREAEGTVELFPEYAAALDGLEGFERIWLLAWLHRGRPWQARVVPYRDTVERGLFATRAPSRPNPIGLSAVRLLGVDGTTLHVAGLDLLDGTPVLDIKPYAPLFDAFPEARAGWLDATSHAREAADERFEGEGPLGSDEPA